ncbi:KH domain-containing protein [Chloropicon primus]|uniref:K Homology domain-containing protein n=1 Tax=Chloropicon primus TaxID=1764295 RepID=A0A5B8MPF3_9CHLO|nr:hypothetical protein A3770_07p48740 [Chloropicon primus]UPR01573.1 KH domain-containing protein [Chloropicon primus]|eukprot:QDZ22356.1 hypothetical protein A3770_07p48740 [Chloropicon primus]
MSFKDAVSGRPVGEACASWKNLNGGVAPAPPPTPVSVVVDLVASSGGPVKEKSSLLVALELKCVDVSQQECKSDSENGCTVLHGPYVFVEAKLHDVSSSTSTAGSALTSGANSSCSNFSGKPRQLRLNLDGGDVEEEEEASEYNFDYPATPHEKVSVELDCPQRFVGRLIGKRGSTIKRLEQTTGVSIQIDQNLPEGQPRRVKLSGHPSMIDEAEKVVREVINYGPPELNKKNVYKTTVNKIACETANKLNESPDFREKRPGRRAWRNPNHHYLGSPLSPPPPPPLADLGDYGAIASGSPGLFDQSSPLYGQGGPLPVPGLVPQPYFSPLPAAAALPGSVYMPGFPNMKPSFKVAATAALAANRFWSECRTATGEKFFLNQYTGELLTDM